MWLTVRAEIDLPELEQLTGRGPIVADADLNLNPMANALG